MCFLPCLVEDIWFCSKEASPGSCIIACHVRWSDFRGVIYFVSHPLQFGEGVVVCPCGAPGRAALLIHCICMGGGFRDQTQTAAHCWEHSCSRGCLHLMATEILCVTQTRAIGAEGIQGESPQGSHVCAQQCRLRQAPKLPSGILSAPSSRWVLLCPSAVAVVLAGKGSTSLLG